MEITIMNFSGVYREETFWREEDHLWVELGDIPGTNCYCDQEASEEILRRLGAASASVIRFLDSGNYHYVSRLLMNKIRQPFRLLVFDNHTDMQLPAFGGLLSCGGWIESAFMELEDLQEVYLVGPSEEDFSSVRENLQSRVRFWGRQALARQRGEGVFSFLEDFPSDLPLYLSIDKDVLCEACASTSWSQGDMSLWELLAHLEVVLSALKEKGGRVLAVDICGEGSCGNALENARNDGANKALLTFFKKYLDDRQRRETKVDEE
ncbi:MAG: arginase family protein [Eubacteriales bacterium]|nr:arginase family protein [Eubacteriales bacterium]